MPATRPAAPRARWRRLGLLFLLAFLALLILTLLAAPATIRNIAERELQDAGFPEVRIAGLRLASDGLRIARIDLAPRDRFFLRDIRLRVSWSSLRAGGAETLTIGEARLDAEMSSGGGFQLPGFRPPTAVADAAGAPIAGLPLERARLNAGRLTLATPQGPLALAIEDARATITGAQIALQAGLTAEHGSSSLSGTLAADAALDRESYAGHLAIASGKLSEAGLIVRELSGTVSVTLESDAPLRAELALAGDGAAYRELALGPANFEAEVSGFELDYRLRSLAQGALGLDVGGTADLEARQARLSGEVEIPSLAALPGSMLNGRLRLRADLDIALNPDGPQANGRFSVAAEELAQPDRFERGALGIAGRIDTDSTRLTLTADAPWQAEAKPLAQILPQALQAYAGRLVAIRLAPPEDGGAMMLEVDLSQRTASLRGAMTARAADSRLQAAAELQLASSELGLDIEAHRLALSAQDLRWDTLVLGIEGFSGEAGLSAGGRYRLSGAGELAIDGKTASLGIEDGEISWSGRISGDAEELRIEPDRCVDLRARSVTVGKLRIESPETPCLVPQDARSLLRYDMAERMTDLSVQSEAGPLDFTLAKGEERHRLTGRWPKLSLAARLGINGPESITAELDGGALQIAGQPYRAEGMSAALRMAAGRLESATFKAAEIESLEEPALFAPLGLEATAGRDGDVLSLEAFLSDAMGLFVFEAVGRATARSGKLDLTLYPIEFLPEATEPGDLSPALGALVTDMRGPLAFAGGITWDADGIRSSGSLELGPLSFAAAGLRLSGLEGSIALASLLPLSTVGSQELRLGAANIGLPLTDGRLVFVLEPGGRISVEDLRFDLAGGRLSADPFILDLSRPQDTAVTMRANGVDLEKLVILSGIDGLQGKGELTGRLPLALTADGLTIADGLFEAAGGGVLRYIPEELPAFLKGDDLRSRMLRDALQNFQYDSLSLTLSGDVGAEQRIALSASGANPDFLEGHPVELNVTVAGPLVSVVQSAIGGSGARALERMFRNSDGEPGSTAPGQEGRP